MRHLILFIFISVIGLTRLVQVQAQGGTVTYRHWNTNGTAHILYLENGKDGTFYERNPSYSKFGTVSYGIYHEYPSCFLLTSHQDIMLGPDYEILANKNYSQHINVDSLCIEIITPYEDEMHYIDSIPYQLSFYDGYQRVYCYRYHISCANDSLSRAFEHSFNERFDNEKSNRIQVYIPSDVSIQSITVKIVWNPDCNDSLLDRSIPYCWSTIQLHGKNDNLFHFEFPQFDYFFMSYKRYNQLNVKKISRNKIEIEGLVFMRLTNHRLRVEARRFEKNHIRYIHQQDIARIRHEQENKKQ